MTSHQRAVKRDTPVCVCDDIEHFIENVEYTTSCWRRKKHNFCPADKINRSTLLISDPIWSTCMQQALLTMSDKLLLIMLPTAKFEIHQVWNIPVPACLYMAPDSVDLLAHERVAAAAVCYVYISPTLLYYEWSSPENQKYIYSSILWKLIETTLLYRKQPSLPVSVLLIKNQRHKVSVLAAVAAVSPCTSPPLSSVVCVLHCVNRSHLKQITPHLSKNCLLTHHRPLGHIYKCMHPRREFLPSSFGVKPLLLLLSCSCMCITSRPAALSLSPSHSSNGRHQRIEIECSTAAASV